MYSSPFSGTLAAFWFPAKSSQVCVCVCVYLCYKMSTLLILTAQFLLGTAIQTVREIGFVCVDVEGISTKVTFGSH